MLKSLKSMESNKSPGNDGLSKEFYECFWDEIKKPFLASIHKAFLNQELSTSQKQTVIKLLEKKVRDKRFIKNWRPISLLNTGMKIISKVLSTRIKNVLLFQISYNQTAYVKNRFISESGRVTSDILEIANTLALEVFLVTIDVEKAFDSVNHSFLLQIPRKFGFAIDFVSWIKTILNNQESCIINGGKSTKYFKLERGARQGDQISAHLFTLVLEIFFIFVKNNPKVKGLNIFKHEFLYIADADDATFFLNDVKSIIELMNELNTFSNFSGLKLNKTKCVIAGIGVLNGVQVALCGMKCVNLNSETVKILGVHFSYNKTLEQDRNFSEHVARIENILKLWRMRQLTLEGRITVFKSLAISKVIHVFLITKLHNNTIDLMYKIQKNFIW